MAKILIIDDDADFILATKAILEAAGHQVITAPDGKTGLEAVKVQDPDLIILDIMMDSIYEGFSVTTTLRGTPEYMDYRDIPVLMGFGREKDDRRTVRPAGRSPHGRRGRLPGQNPLRPMPC